MDWHARYELQWGHTVASREGPVEVTRLEYNEQAGAESPPQPEIPACAEHIWFWWWELNARRPSGFDALAPIPYSEINHWLRLTGRAATYTDIRWLIAMDNGWMQAIARERADKREREKEAAERNKPKGRK